MLLASYPSHTSANLDCHWSTASWGTSAASPLSTDVAVLWHFWKDSNQPLEAEKSSWLSSRESIIAFSWMRRPVIGIFLLQALQNQSQTSSFSREYVLHLALVYFCVVFALVFHRLKVSSRLWMTVWICIFPQLELLGNRSCWFCFAGFQHLHSLLQGQNLSFFLTPFLIYRGDSVGTVYWLTRKLVTFIDHLGCLCNQPLRIHPITA